MIHKIVTIGTQPEALTFWMIPRMFMNFANYVWP